MSVWDSDGSFLNNSFILNKSLMLLGKNESSRGVIDSFSRACSTSYRFCTELFHLFQVFGFFESFVHHMTAPYV